MYLSQNTVIQCSHGGKLQPNRRHFIKFGDQKVLTRQAVLEGKIVGCPHSCEHVTELIAGYESPTDNSPLLMNLEFLTDGDPPGTSVVLAEPPHHAGADNARAILLTSLVWLLVSSAAVLGTAYIYDMKHLQRHADDKTALDKCAEEREYYKREVAKPRANPIPTPAPPPVLPAR